MTVEELLKLDKPALDAELGKMRPGPWKHGGYGLQCFKCGCFAGPSTDCPVPTPIDSEDWNVAMVFIRETFVTDRQRSDYMIELVDMCDAAPVDYLDGEDDFMLWLLFITQPRKLWIAAYLAWQGEKE